MEAILWLLLIFTINTTEVTIEERGFKSLQHCEARARVWRDIVSPDKYRVVCIASTATRF